MVGLGSQPVTSDREEEEPLPVQGAEEAQVYTLEALLYEED